MALLFFDVVSLVADGIHVAANANKKSTFAQLGMAPGEPLVLHAREIRLLGAPDDRRLTLVTDRLVCHNGAALQFPNPGLRAASAASVEIWAQRIDGALTVRTHGRKGVAGAKGTKGSPAEFTIVRVVDPGTPGEGGGPFQKPTFHFEKRLTKAAGNGGQGRQGAQGEAGPAISVNYVTTTATPTGVAVGGDGGDGGAGGDPGSGGQEFPDGQPGLPGPSGTQGPAGPVSIRQRSSATSLWADYLSLQRDAVVAWSRHQLAVAEHHYRTGTLTGIETAKGLLGIVATRPQPYGSQEQVCAGRLLQQIFEHVTFLGLPRELDVVPDVVFASSDNDDILDAVRDFLNAAIDIANTQAVERRFEETMRFAATQAGNAVAAADERIDEAAAHLDAAMTSTDVARARAENIKSTIDELQRAIEKESEDPSWIATAFKIAGVAVAMIGVVAGVATGAGAIVAFAGGVATVKGIADAASDTFEAIDEIKAEIKEGDLSKFVESIEDIGKAGKSLISIEKIVEDLKSLEAKHPADKIREMARLQREHVLLMTEIGLHQQMEKVAQLGKSAAILERAAIDANIRDANRLADQIRDGAAARDAVLLRLLVTCRVLLDMLQTRLFHTVRAREIYLARDAVTVIRHDVGHLHPDVQKVLSPAEQAQAVLDQLGPFTADVISWSSIAGEISQVGTLSHTPAPFVFATTDAEHLASLQTDTPTLAFVVDIDDITELNGSQIYEARFDRIEVTFHGARVADDNTADAILLRSFGHWSMRRRPSSDEPQGAVKTFALPSREVQLTGRQEGNVVRATYEESINPDALPPDSIWGRGIAANWQLVNDGGIDFSGVIKVEVAFIARALSGQAPNGTTRTGTLLLEPLAGGLPDVVGSRPPTPIPPRVPRLVSYPGSVAAVGAGLL